MYISYAEYTELYGTVENFNRLAYDACREIDRITTGADGVKKLKIAFPTNSDDVDAIKHCAAHIINILAQIQEAENSASMGRGLVQTANGLQGKIVTSVSAGNESISFSTGTNKTAADMAAADPAMKREMIRQEVRNYLSGVADRNGVNLLYMGRYPV